MKKNCLILPIVAVILAVVLPVHADKREHRAVWMSAYVNDWPTSAIRSDNADFHKQVCINNLDSLSKNNMTTIYYHVRAMSDAMYDSKYEPWSSFVSPSRGTAPAFDPFAYLIENAHSRGMEVYAWLNPYRYINSIYSDGYGTAGGDKNYENSHPDWLIKYQTSESGSTRTHTILNPALPEVKQRIVDVIADIMDKYDVDGIIFDDYFYQSGLPMSYDATDYTKYTTAGGTLSQADWRRENINDMVRKVNNYIKSTKPWVRFGIGPAGVACGTNLTQVAAGYGIEPCPGSDWQYNSIYSDPIAWFNEGSIDFMSPQVYWPINGTNDYRAVSTWWYQVAAKFNRHAYISQDLSNTAGSKAPLSEFLDEIDVTRTADLTGAPGTVYFPWKSLKARTHKVDGKNQFMLNFLRLNAFNTIALTPAVTWVQTSCPGQVSKVTRSGRTLTWDGPENVKYTVYAVPTDITMAEFHKEAEYLRAISYTKSYEIPAYDAKYEYYGIADANLDKYNYAVCVLDRYGNEYSAVFEGATVGASEKPVITYPANGTKAPAAFNLQWSGKASAYEIAIATDAQMKNIVVKREVSGNCVASSDLYEFEADKTYYATVTARENNATETTSEVVSFIVDVYRILSPANGAKDCDDNLTITWSEAAGDNTLTIAKDALMSDIVCEKVVKGSSFQVPECVLMGNTTYYAQVRNGAFASKVSSFTVKNIVPGVPVFTNPTTNGQTIFSNHRICVKPERGINLTRIEVCGTESFSPRSSYIFTGKDFEFMTPELGGLKLGSTPFADGKTYYVRARYTYYNEESKTVDTEYSPVMNFVYNAEAGVSSAEADNVRIIDNTVIAEANEAVEVYSLDGKQVLAAITDEAGRASLAQLQPGSYIVKVAGKATKVILR